MGANHSWSLFFKEQQERIAHSHSLKWAILSKNAKSKRAKERKSDFPTLPSLFLYSTTVHRIIPNKKLPGLLSLLAKTLPCFEASQKFQNSFHLHPFLWPLMSTTCYLVAQTWFYPFLWPLICLPPVLQPLRLHLYPFFWPLKCLPTILNSFRLSYILSSGLSEVTPFLYLLFTSHNSQLFCPLTPYLEWSPLIPTVFWKLVYSMY